MKSMFEFLRTVGTLLKIKYSGNLKFFEVPCDTYHIYESNVQEHASGAGKDPVGR